MKRNSEMKNNMSGTSQLISAQNKVVQVASTLAIENMYISEHFKDELLLVAQDKKSSKEVLAELDKIYGR